MPLYDVWEKTLIYMPDAPAGPPGGGGGGGGGPGNPPGIWGPPGPWPTPPIYLPPGGPGKPPDLGPPGIWGPPGPWPTPPIFLPPWYPGKPPGIWGPPGPWPTPPIYWPGFPNLPGGRPPEIGGGPIYPPEIWPTPPQLPTVSPLPDTYTVPPSPPTGPPDFASPGAWYHVVPAGRTSPTRGWVQYALNAGEKHKAKPPSVEGDWFPVYSSTLGSTYAWVASAAGSPPGQGPGGGGPPGQGPGGGGPPGQGGKPPEHKSRHQP